MMNWLFSTHFSQKWLYLVTLNLVGRLGMWTSMHALFYAEVKASPHTCKESCITEHSHVGYQRKDLRLVLFESIQEESLFQIGPVHHQMNPPQQRRNTNLLLKNQMNSNSIDFLVSLENFKDCMCQMKSQFLYKERWIEKRSLAIFKETHWTLKLMDNILAGEKKLLNYILNLQ